MAVAAFMATALGRLIRIVVGIALLIAGLAVIAGTMGWIMAAIGVVLALIGVALMAFAAFNVCVIAVFLGAPFSGREALERQKQATLQERSAERSGS
jgi:membrane protein implicated in regulation of membrane protease activity